MRCLVALFAVVAAGCYEPKLQECAVRCSTDEDCAPGQACRPDGWCATPGFADACDPFDPISATPVDASSDANVADAPKPTDAPPPKPCAPGCAGTCDDGTCVIQCLGNNACEEEVVCPLTGPCRVVCTGKKACNQGVRCGFGRCTVACNGDEACHKRVRCEVACACDVLCGQDACKDAALCPHPWCEAGDGCTSMPNGCDTC